MPVWETRTCQTCGAEFPFKPVKSQPNYKGLYCSRACSNKADKPRRRRRGEDHPLWKGGRHIRKRDGYVQVSVRQPDGSRPWVLEHRLVMAEHLGRTLEPYETVHHKNGDKADNRVENLELRVGRHGKGSTDAHCPTCTCFE